MYPLNRTIREINIQACKVKISKMLHVILHEAGCNAFLPVEEQLNQWV